MNKEIEEYSELIKNNPENLDYINWHHDRGLVYWKLKEYEKALADFNKVAQLDKNYPKIWDLRRQVFRDIEKSSSFDPKDTNLKFKYKDEEFEFEHWATGNLGEYSERGNPLGLIKVGTVWNDNDWDDITPFDYIGYPKLISIPDYLSEQAMLSCFVPWGRDGYSIVDILKYFKKTPLNEVDQIKNVFESSKENFMDLISKYGLFSGAWINKMFRKKVYEKIISEVRTDDELIHLNHRVNHAYFGRNNNYQNLAGDAGNQWKYKDKDVLIGHLTDHILWQLILYSIEESWTMRKWIEENSISKECVRCKNNFSPILIHARHFFNTNGNTLQCLNCIELKKPDKENLLDLVKKFVDVLGSAPPDGITPIDPRVNFFISHEKQIEVTDAYCEMGGISYAKYILQKSWFSIMNDAGCLPDGTLELSSYGTKCISKDGHECRSIAERIIDDYLFENNIKHETEPSYPKHNKFNKTKMKADWKVGDRYVEYFGLAGNSDYDKKTLKKYELAKNLDIKIIGIYPEDIYNLNNIFKQFI